MFCTRLIARRGGGVNGWIDEMVVEASTGGVLSRCRGFTESSRHFNCYSLFSVLDSISVNNSSVSGQRTVKHGRDGL